MLKREISFKTLLFLALNGVLGTGIYFLPAIGARVAGPASMISWIIVTVSSVLVATYFAELVMLFPKSGGPYEFVKQVFGVMAAFIVGWTSWIVANITIAMLLVGSFRYLFETSSFVVLVFSIGAILVLNYISYRGVALSGKLLLSLGVLTVACLLTLIFGGLLTVNPNNFSPFFVFPPITMFLAIFFIIETFFGWETITYMTEEAKDIKDVPKVLVLHTLIIAAITFGIVIVALGNIPWNIFGEASAPLALLSEVLFGSEFGRVFGFLIFIPLVGTAASWIITSPRLLYAMSRDRVFLSAFNKIHPKYATPHLAIAFQTVVAIFVTILALGSFEILLSLLLPLVLFVYGVTVLCVTILRLKRPNLKREFKAPLGRIGPVAIVIFYILLVATWLSLVPGSLRLLMLSILLVLTGFPAYVLIRIETSTKSTEKFFDRFSLVWDKAFPLWYGRGELRRVIRNAKIRKGDKVLDFGCATGYTTEAVAKAAGPEGKVVAVDISEKQLKRAVRRIKKAVSIPNVYFVKTLGGVPFEKESFDVITMVGVLEYFRRPEDKLKNLLKSLKKGGRLSAMSFGKALGVPPQSYLKDEKAIKALFKKAGIDVKVERSYKRGCEYWFISGRK